jgi:hypothetical protein
MKTCLTALVAIVAVGLACEPTLARNSSKLRTNRIEIAYVAPKDAKHEELHRLLKERRVLERIKGLLSPLRLPRPLLVKFEGCDGSANAFYEDDAVTVCYEYIDELIRNAPRETTPAGVTRRDAIIAPTVEVFLHELGHAIIDYNRVPVLGREEDAADQLAAYFLLQFDKAEAPRLIAGVAHTYKLDAVSPKIATMQLDDDEQASPVQRFYKRNKVFADEHALPAQRFYNILCMAYGADPKLFAYVVDKGYLPKERAEICDIEYGQVELAMNKLIRPYIDPKLARQVRAKRWLNLDSDEAFTGPVSRK